MISSVQLLKELERTQAIHIHGRASSQAKDIVQLHRGRKVKPSRTSGISSAALFVLPPLGCTFCTISPGLRLPPVCMWSIVIPGSPSFVCSHLGPVNWSHRHFPAIQLALSVEAHFSVSCSLHQNKCKSSIWWWLLSDTDGLSFCS